MCHFSEHLSELVFRFHGDSPTSPLALPAIERCRTRDDPTIIPYLAIARFAGLCSAEVGRLDRGATDLERRTIEIRAGQAKTASRRIVPVSDNLAAWPQPHASRGPVVTTHPIDRWIRPAAKRAGIAWPHNVLRHSFISYRIALVKSADQVALEAGATRRRSSSSTIGNW